MYVLAFAMDRCISLINASLMVLSFFLYIFIRVFFFFLDRGVIFLVVAFCQKILARKHILLLLRTLRLIDRVCLEINVLYTFNKIKYSIDKIVCIANWSLYFFTFCNVGNYCHTI